MSKQSEAKKKQGYATVLNRCRDCIFLIERKINDKNGYQRERLRCGFDGVEGFAVKANAVCNRFKIKK